MKALIVGARKSGKTTLIERVCAELGRPVFGYATKKEVSLADEVMGNPIYIYEQGRERVQTDENKVGWCLNHHFTTIDGVFDSFAPKLAAPAPENSIIVLDEIGFMESESHEFCSAIMERLNGSLPVLAAVKNSDTPFLREVRSHPECRCFYITEENRDELFVEVLEFMRGQLEA